MNQKTKKPKSQKAVFLFFCFSVFLFSFSGCTKQEVTAQKTITIWHWMTDRDAAFRQLAKKYEQKTGIRVDFQLYAPSDAYSQKVRAAAQGANLPDIYGVLGEKRDFASFIKAGFVADLSEYMDENNQQWRSSFFSRALAVNEFKQTDIYGVKPGIYGVPIDVTNIQMLYNKNLFRELGLDPQRPPRTWEEFLDVGKKIKEKGLQGMVSGWGEVWMIDCFASNYAFNIMGQKKVLATIRGQVPYTDPDWIKVFDLFRQMQEGGLLYNGIVTMINKTAEQLFANNRAVFAFNGSWCVNVYQEMNPQLDYGALLPPRISNEYPMRIWGGAGSSFMVNNQSPNKEEAITFLKWLTAQEQQTYLAQATRNLPANKNSLSQISQILAQFADDMDQTTHPSVWGVSEFPTVIEAFDKGIQSIIIGEKTPQEVASQVEKVKQRELKKRKKDNFTKALLRPTQVTG
jgi:ABC-type glycerol-3-phosphate transport system substrate-binding protein